MSLTLFVPSFSNISSYLSSILVMSSCTNSWIWFKISSYFLCTISYSFLIKLSLSLLRASLWWNFLISSYSHIDFSILENYIYLCSSFFWLSISLFANIFLACSSLLVISISSFYVTSFTISYFDFVSWYYLNI